MADKDITKDIKRFSEAQYNIGYISALDNGENGAFEVSLMISDYITELLLAKRGEVEE